MTRLSLLFIVSAVFLSSQAWGEDWANRDQRVHDSKAKAGNEPGFLHLTLADAASGEEATTTAPAEKEPQSETVHETEIERGPLPTFGATVKRDAHDMWCDLWNDTKAVYLNPYNVAFLVSAGGISLSLRPEVDDDFQDHYSHSHTFSKGFRNFLDAGGSPATGAIVAGTWYLAGQILQQDKTYEVGKRLASALIITDVSTVLLKVSAYTKGPNGQRGAWPSGHMSSTMCLATVLNEAYGPVVGVPMFTFTAFLGIERLDDREHQFSDVIFGTALGWLIAEQVMKEHCPQIFGGDLVPYCDPESGATGIGWIKTLGN